MRPVFRVHVLPGGQLPKRQTEGAVGFDAHLRAIVSPTEMDPENPQLRKTIFDFEDIPADLNSGDQIRYEYIPGFDDPRLVYRLLPGELVLGGIGIITQFPFPYFMGIWPRSGLLIKYRIDVSNAPGTVDPDYRGEAGVLIENKGNRPFPLHQGIRIAQLVFQSAVIPDLDCVQEIEELSTTERHASGFGSTGV